MGQGFLKIARFIIDMYELQQLKRERQAVALAKFGEIEVEEFREIFRRMDSGADGTVSRRDFSKLLSDVVGSAATAAEWTKLTALLKASGCEGDGVDFPEFLSLMRKLQQEDWAHINSQCAAFVRKEE